MVRAMRGNRAGSETGLPRRNFDVLLAAAQAAFPLGRSADPVGACCAWRDGRAQQDSEAAAMPQMACCLLHVREAAARRNSRRYNLT